MAICKKCNTEVPEGTTFCPVCGAAIETEADLQRPTVDFFDGEGSADLAVKTKKPSFKFKPIYAIIAAVLVVVLVSSFAIYGAVAAPKDRTKEMEKDPGSFLVKTFSERTAEDLKAFEVGYDVAKAGIDGDSYKALAAVTPSKTSIEFEPGSFIQSALGAYGLGNVTLKPGLFFESAYDKANSSVTFGLTNNGQDLLSFAFATALTNKDLFIGIPSLTDTYLTLPAALIAELTEQLQGLAGASGDVPDTSALQAEISKLSANDISAIVTKVTDAIYKDIFSKATFTKAAVVSKSGKSFTSNEFTVAINSQVLGQALVDALKIIRDEKALDGVLSEFIKLANSESDEVLSIDDAIVELEKELSSDRAATGDFALDLLIYLDNPGEFAGIAAKNENSDFGYIFDNVNVVAWADSTKEGNLFALVGTYASQKDSKTGSFTVTSGKLDKSRADVTFDLSKASKKLSVDLTYAGIQIGKITFTNSDNTDAKPIVPSESDKTYDASKQEDIVAFLKGIDYDAYIASLSKKIGVDLTEYGVANINELVYDLIDSTFSDPDAINDILEGITGDVF